MHTTPMCCTTPLHVPDPGASQISPMSDTPKPIKQFEKQAGRAAGVGASHRGPIVAPGPRTAQARSGRLLDATPADGARDLDRMPYVACGPGEADDGGERRPLGTGGGGQVLCLTGGLIKRKAPQTLCRGWSRGERKETTWPLLSPLLSSPSVALSGAFTTLAPRGPTAFRPQASARSRRAMQVVTSLFCPTCAETPCLHT